MGGPGAVGPRAGALRVQVRDEGAGMVSAQLRAVEASALRKLHPLALISYLHHVHRTCGWTT
eukprot:9473969-Pyramimonas_sp.AAC.1